MPDSTPFQANPNVLSVMNYESFLGTKKGLVFYPRWPGKFLCVTPTLSIVGNLFLLITFTVRPHFVVFLVELTKVSLHILLYNNKFKLSRRGIHAHCHSSRLLLPVQEFHLAELRWHRLVPTSSDWVLNLVWEVHLWAHISSAHARFFPLTFYEPKAMSSRGCRPHLILLVLVSMGIWGIIPLIA